MAFTTEDGTVVADANAYGTVAGFQTYHTDRGNDYSAYSSTQIEQAIVRATTYIDASYTFKGTIVDTDQELAWPREGVYDKNSRLIASNVIPDALLAATYELAFYALANAITSNVTGDQRLKRVAAGSVEVEYESGAKELGTRFDFVDRLLMGLTVGGTGMIRMAIRGF